MLVIIKAMFKKDNIKLLATHKFTTQRTLLQENAY